ncbi:MAG TPA: efflux transporter outer membrane subunit [Burkholderiaceae bacterium]|nr:efflux transporter outer membrane subunit [Burkholderiaceae bacterium]
MNLRIRRGASRAAGALLALPAALLGCAAGPDYRVPPTPLPARFLAPGDAYEQGAPERRWWTLFSDDNLAALVERATGGASLDVQAAEARIREARAELGVAGAIALPSVSASARVSRDKVSRDGELFANVPLPNPQTLFTDYRAGFDASWEPDLFGRARRTVEAASARLQGAQASAADVRIAVAAEVASTYVQLRVAEARTALAEADRDALAETARLVQLRVDAGSASLLERRRSRAAVEVQEAAIERLRAERMAARDALAVLLGMLPAETESLLQPGRPIPTVDAGRIDVGLPSELLQRRADVRRAERDLAAANAEIGVAAADLYPRFQLVASLGFDAIHPGDFGSGASRAWSLAPIVSLPLFDRGRLKSEVAAREAARDAAIAAYRRAVLRALGDAETAMIRYGSERARVARLRAAAEELRDTAALARTQYDAGRASLVDVLDVERQARAAADQLADAEGGAATQLVALYKALGGGWADDGAAAGRAPATPEIDR